MPTYTTYALRTILQWRLPGGEVAQCRVHWRSESGTFAIDTTIADAFAARGAAYWGDIDGVYGDDVVYEGMKLQLLGLDGLVLESVDRFISGTPGASATISLPQEVAIVASLRTNGAGRSDRGRMYLPPPRVGMLLETGRLDSAGAAALSSGTAAFLAPLTASGETFTASVQSPTTSLYKPITLVSVGDVFDAQRRRRDNLVEVRVNTPVT